MELWEAANRGRAARVRGSRDVMGKFRTRLPPRDRGYPALALVLFQVCPVFSRWELAGLEHV